MVGEKRTGGVGAKEAPIFVLMLLAEDTQDTNRIDVTMLRVDQSLCTGGQPIILVTLTSADYETGLGDNCMGQPMS